MWLLVTEQDDSPTEAALRDIPNVVLTTAKLLPSDLAETSLIVFDGQTPRQLPQRPTLVLGPTSATDLWKIGATIQKPQATLATSHPLLDGVDLRDVIIDESANVTGGTPVPLVLVAASGGASLYAVIPRETGDVAVLSFSTRTSDLALHDDFARLIANAVDWLTRDGPARQSWQTDETYDGLQIRPTSEEHIVSPYGQSTANAANLNDVGIWQLQDADGKLTAVLPVNLENASESNLAARDAQRSTAWPHVNWWPDLGPLWMPLTALALIWIAGHWAFYQRRDID